MSRAEPETTLMSRSDEQVRPGQPLASEEVSRTLPEPGDELKPLVEPMSPTLLEPAAPASPPSTRLTLANLAAPLAAPPPLVAIPGYEVLGELGRGGMGVVYKARQIKANRLVALKMILASRHASMQEKVRFQIEAEAIARLQHANIVQLYEADEHEGLPFFSLEFCDGGSLDRRLATQPLTTDEAAALMEKLARAMHYAHVHGVVHRDLKPANVLLDSAGLPKVTDFGLAKQMDSGSDLSHTGAVMGTPAYMAPEQAEGRTHEIGPAADVYALGAMLYEFLTGQTPFQSNSAIETMRRLTNEEPAPPSRVRPGIPPDLETICLKCLHKDQSRRYASAEVLAEDLRRYREGEPISARRVGRLERAVKWVRRRPAISALLLVLVSVIGLAVGLVTWKWREATQWAKDEAAAHADAQAQREQADEQKRVAEEALEQAEQSMYIQSIGTAERENLAGNSDRALRVLDASRPELRNWEWHYMRRVIRSQAFSRARRGTANGDHPPVDWHDFLRSRRPSPYPELLRLDSSMMADGSRLAWPRMDGAVLLLDAATRTERRLQAGTKPVEAVALSPDGKLLAAACWERFIKVFNTATGEVVCTCSDHTAPVNAVVFTADSKRLITAGRDSVIKVWDAANGTLIRTLDGATNGETQLAVSRDGTRVAGGGYGSTACVWDLNTGKVLLTMPNHKEPVRAAAFSDDGAMLATAGDDRTVKLASMESGARFGLEITTFRGHTGSVDHLAFSADGKRLASCSGQPLVGEIRVWDLKGWREVRYLSHFQGEVRATIFIGQHNVLTLSVGSKESEVTILDTVANKVIARFASEPLIQSATADLGGRYVAVSVGDANRADDHFKVKVFRIDDQSEVLSLSGAGRIAHAVALNHDGTRLATASLDGALKIWQVPSGKEVASFRLDGEGRRPPRPHQGVGSVVFSPDGGQVAAVNKDGTITVWDVLTQREVRRFVGHGGRVHNLIFNPKGRFLASAADLDLLQPNESPTKMWDVDRGGEPYTLQGLSGGQHDVAFTPDGSRLATGGEFGVTTFWETGGGRLVVSRRDVATPKNGVSFSSDGTVLLMGEQFGFLILWDATPER